MTPAELRERVAELDALDKTRSIFGAIGHHYRFAPRLSEDTLVTHERAHGYTLPDDYRAYLLELGNGGPGPYYGVIGWRTKNAEDYTKYEDLGRPFAYAHEYNPTHFLDVETDDDDEDDEPRNQYWEAFDDRGSLVLSHQGCGLRVLLVVSGPCRGEVWDDSIADDGGYTPLVRPDGARHTFTSWYAEWLATSFAELRRA